jgi:hypothetical protein
MLYTLICFTRLYALHAYMLYTLTRFTYIYFIRLYTLLIYALLIHALYTCILTRYNGIKAYRLRKKYIKVRSLS